MGGPKLGGVLLGSLRGFEYLWGQITTTWDV
jgi:hypothetical protein